mmetsp:Transcript_15957/g.38111  ORF Transcript_15957/g.38111 Transcript_15957/m.38111 type:complete len:418 (-) Transcript_15957:155-1408(-)
MKLALVILLALNVLPTAVNGHAELLYPMSRNVDEARKIQSGYCPHCGQSGGTALVAKRLFETDSDFPTEYQIPSAEGTHGLCGDPFQSLAQANGFLEPIANQPFMTPGDVKATFVEGDVVELQIGVSTNHKGFFEFKICDEVLDTNTESQVAGQACLDKYTLVRPDPANRPECEGVSLQANPDCQPLDLDYPTRWYIPPDAYASPAQGYPHHPIFKMKYQLPPGLKCEKCTMQWWWLTANSCHPKGEREWRAYMTSLNVPGAWTYQSDMSECSRSSQVSPSSPVCLHADANCVLHGDDADVDPASSADVRAVVWWCRRSSSGTVRTSASCLSMAPSLLNRPLSPRCQGPLRPRSQRHRPRRHRRNKSARRSRRGGHATSPRAASQSIGVDSGRHATGRVSGTHSAWPTARARAACAS